MGSIAPTPPQTQEQHIPEFQYALRLTPERVKSLTPQQKEQALLEFITLFSIILSVIYNPIAKEATRLLALDVIVSQVQRSAHKLIKAVTDKSLTFAFETEKRLGLSKNTISNGYKTLEKAGVLERSYRTDEITQQKHLDIAPTPALFTKPSLIQDKKKRAAPKPKLQIKPVDPARECMACGSHNLRVTCRDCADFIDLGDVKPRLVDADDKPQTQETPEQASLTTENEAVTNFGTFSSITPPHSPEEDTKPYDAGQGWSVPMTEKPCKKL